MWSVQFPPCLPPLRAHSYPPKPAPPPAGQSHCDFARKLQWGGIQHRFPRLHNITGQLCRRSEPRRTVESSCLPSLSLSLSLSLFLQDLSVQFSTRRLLMGRWSARAGNFFCVTCRLGTWNYVISSHPLIDRETATRSVGRSPGTTTSDYARTSGASLACV